MGMNMPRFHVYSVANDANVLARDLQSSPDIAGGAVPLSVLWNEVSASAAYARALANATADFLIFVHQDIYLPRHWFDRLGRFVEQLNSIDEQWAVAGSLGVTHSGQFVGHMWDSGLGCVCGAPFIEPTRAASFDEIVLIVRRSANIGFDPALPGFHFYGTDIVLNAEARGKTAYVLHLPLVHNTKPLCRLGSDYAESYRFMVRKWHDRLPWPTVIVPLTKKRRTLAIRRLRVRYKGLFRASLLGAPLPDPAAKAHALGYDVP